MQDALDELELGDDDASIPYPYSLCSSLAQGSRIIHSENKTAAV